MKLFETLEESFELLDAKLLNEKEINSQSLEKILEYVKYCENKLNKVLDEITNLQESDEKAKILKLIEDVYQEKILYLLEDVSTEMYNLQAILSPQKEKNSKISSILEDIDGVEALLMLIPEEVEKLKCLFIAFLK